MQPSHDIDLNYIFSHCDLSNFEIPYYYDREIWKPGETYRIRISNIYDPSKFWIVLKERELDIFQKFITNFYQKLGSYYKMCSITASKNMYCVVFTENAFYRGLIVNIPHSLSLEKKAVVFLIDFGFISVINIENIYYLAEKFYKVPQFAVRASLNCLQPYDKYTWDLNVVKRFSELVLNKMLLCILECTDPSRRIVEIRVGCVNDFSTVIDVGNILIDEKLARTTTKKEFTTKSLKDSSRYIPRTKYPYLFPSFEAIEGGIVPPSVYTSELLRQCVATDVLFKPYYVYRGISEQ